jgi:hypothetical protein
MANHALPTTTDTYANVLSYIDARLDDLSRWNGTAYAEPTGLITGAIRWNATTFRWDTWNGTNWTTPLTTRLDITAFNGSIGATTPSTGAFTTLSSSGIASLGASSTVGGVAIVTTTGTQTLTNKTMSTGSVWNGGIIPILYGGTGSSTSAGAAFAIKGANADLTTISTLASFGNTSTTHVRVSTTGLVGINTVADTGVRLHVKDTVAAIKSEGTAGYGSFYATSSSGQPSYMFFGTAGAETGRIAVTAAGIITLSNGVAATERLRIDASGLVGIGATSTGGILEVTRNQNAATYIAVKNSDTGASAASLLQLATGSRFTNLSTNYTASYFAIQGAGGINTKYEDFDTHDWRNNVGTSNLTLDTNGNLTARNSIFARGTIQARTLTSSFGFAGIQPGSAANSGYIEFWSHTGNIRQGYIGFSATNSATNTGTIPYVAGLHAFSGSVTVTTSGATGFSVTDTGASGANIKLSGNGAVTPDKYIRATSGLFQIINSAYTNAILELTDAGNLIATLFTGPVTALKSATTSVNVSSAAAPTSGQVLMATSGTAAEWQSVSSAPRGYIDGLIMSTAGSSTTMTIGAGQASNSTASVSMSLASSLAKTTSAWAVGTTVGGLDTGTIAANTWYHFYLIRRPDTGVVDVCFSTNATSPTYPTNYTQHRRIGAGRTNASSQWLAFTQVGSEFVWNSPVLDINTSALSTTTTNYTLTGVPSGISVVAHINAFLDHASAQVQLYLNSPMASDEGAVDTGRISLTAGTNPSDTANRFSNAGQFNIVTNTSAQIQAVSTSSATIFRAGTAGWTDPRGENA